MQKCMREVYLQISAGSRQNEIRKAGPPGRQSAVVCRLTQCQIASNPAIVHYSYVAECRSFTLSNPSLIHQQNFGEILMKLFFPYIPGHDLTLRGIRITFRHITLDRTLPDERSARRTDLYPTTRNTYNRQTSMPMVGFEPTIPAGEQAQT